MAKFTLDDVTKTYPAGTKVTIKAGRQSPRSVTAEVVRVREAGVANTKGHSIWVDTRETLEGGKTVERSIRPGSLTAA